MSTSLIRSRAIIAQALVSGSSVAMVVAMLLISKHALLPKDFSTSRVTRTAHCECV